MQNIKLFNIQLLLTTVFTLLLFCDKSDTIVASEDSKPKENILVNPKEITVKRDALYVMDAKNRKYVIEKYEYKAASQP